MATHFAAEQAEIVLFNELKALFNSVRSSALRAQNPAEMLDAAEVLYVGERLNLVKASLKSLKNLNKRTQVTLKKSLNGFKKSLSETSARLIMHVFKEKVIVPLEAALLKIHSTKEGKQWIKTCFVIFRT